MPVCHLTRIVAFTARHRIRRADWSPEQNAREFGAAATDHEHRYECRVTVKGPLAARAPGVMSLGALDALLAAEVTERFDGRHLDDVVSEFASGRELATGEALAVDVWRRLAARLPSGVALHAVRIQESAALYAEYFGEP